MQACLTPMVERNIEDIAGRIDSQEREEHLNGRRILVYRYSDDEEGNFRISTISPTSQDSISSFLENEIEEVREDIKQTRQEKFEVGSTVRHGRTLSKRRIREIREGKESKISSLEEKLRVLEGEIVYPLVIEREEGEATGSNLSLSRKESSWWGYLKSHPEILEIHSEDRKLLLDAFFARYGISKGEENSSKKYDDVRKRLRKKEHLVPYVVEITQMFTE